MLAPAIAAIAVIAVVLSMVGACWLSFALRKK